MTEPDRYPPIAAHGVIGNMRTAALVAADGAVDWACLPDLDDASVFASILDARRGGRFRIAPPSAGLGTQRYVAGTNVLETMFQTATARVTLTDFMPVDGDLTGTGGPADPDPAIVRLVACDGGSAEVDVEWSPRFDYARGPVRMSRAGGVWIAESGGARLSLGGVPTRAGAEVTSGEDGGPTLRARVMLGAGDRIALVTWLHADGAAGERAWSDPGAAPAALERTVRAWRAWAAGDVSRHGEPLGGAWAEHVARSALVLKLLAHRHTGAIAAAPTTSLPEWIGGVRNWDYRYVWVRDAALTAQALNALRHEREARDFLTWVQGTSKASDPKAFELQIMYGLHGEKDLKEIDLPHLEGYRGSRPVRIGNAASEQFQLDIYGELMNAAFELTRMRQSIEPDLWTFLRAVADRVCERWREPDHGIWEVRTAPRHFVYSKVMAWVALDRAIRMVRHFQLTGPVARWQRQADAIRAAVLSEGYDERGGAFRQAFGDTHVDAANLLISQVGLLPHDDPRVRRNIDRTLAELTENGVVHRYLSDDGIPGSEGAFVFATCWMVDALALAGRLDEARTLFDGVAARANPLGLFAEQFDPKSGAQLGNFPQAFSHIGFVNSALRIGDR
ncbi:MAG: glycoside hydrolase family 15 protein [Gemmatimonadaceae bacterium]